MKLFRWENNDIWISEEALTIKPFRKIWSRDRSDSKNKAKQDLAFLYFYCDPRSDYSFLLNSQDRLDKIRIDIGVDDKWEPDSLLKEAMETYIYLTTTTKSRLLKAAYQAAESIIEQLENPDLLKETDDKGKPINTIQSVTAALTRVPEVISQIQKAEELLNKEIAEASRMRGKAEKKIFEDGF